MTISVPDLHRAVADLLAATHLMQADDLADTVNESVRGLDMRCRVYLVDMEQRALRALPQAGDGPSESVPLEGSPAGDAFTHVRIVRSPDPAEPLWVPVVDGTERLGVAQVVLPDATQLDDPSFHTALTALTGLIGHLVMAKTAYGDRLRAVRRSRPMSTEGELLWRNLPPLTFATKSIAISAVLEPCYEVGGDSFDYAVDEDHARLAIFDAVGHGLTAGLTTVLTLAAVRAARSRGADLVDLALAADEALSGQFSDLRYTTAILADLDTRTGLLRYLNAGHPAPVVMRAGRAIAHLDRQRRLPLGLGDPHPVVTEYRLEPGDRLLLYTDGITEARGPDGRQFGLDRLIDLAERHSADGLPVPEVLRRLSHAVIDHQSGPLRDDATLMIVEWVTGAGARILP